MEKSLRPENIVLLFSADVAPFSFGYPEPNVKKSVKCLTHVGFPETDIEKEISSSSKSGDFAPSKGSRNTLQEKELGISTLDKTFSANAKFYESSNCIHDDTLSMISSPWTTESWSWACDKCPDKFSSSYTAYDQDTMVFSHCTSTATILPNPSTSYGISICERDTNSNTTRTVFNVEAAGELSESCTFPVNGKEDTGSETISSWTSTLLDRAEDGVSAVLRVSYPWSPSSCVTTNKLSKTDSDLYPSSSATKGAVFGVSTDSTLPIPPYRCKVNQMTMTFPCSRVKVGVTAMEYLLMSTEQLDAYSIAGFESQII